MTKRDCKMIRSRKEVAAFVVEQLSSSAKTPTGQIGIRVGCPFHYGKCALRDLMDFIYGGPPAGIEEEIGEPLRLRNKVGKWRE